MPTAFQSTQLSVPNTATAPNPRHMADTDRESFAFDANEAITGATVVLTRLDTNEAVTEPIESESHAGEIETVVISGLTRGVTYELAVTFSNAAGRRWSRTLIIECVS